MKMQLNWLVLVVTFAFSCGVVYAATSDTPDHISGGVLEQSPSVKFEASAAPLPLPRLSRLTVEQRAVVARAQTIMQNNATLSMLLIDHGKIIFESYRKPASESSPQFSWSMSKSLTSYTVGTMHCSDSSLNLDEPVGAFVAELNTGAFKTASVRNLLTMSSGLPLGTSGGARRPGEFINFATQKVSLLDHLKVNAQENTTPGKEFRYSNADTNALAVVADSSGGFLENFNKNIWKNIGAEFPGYWTVDQERRALAFSGLSVTTRDWARLAMYTIKMLKSKDSCIRNYMQQATSTQIKNYTGRTGESFKGYGYQTWTDNKFDNGKSFWWVGYAGQRVGIDPHKEKIMVVSSWREDYMIDLYRLFADFQKTD